ncbi:MAG TPA: HNH endonuclease [Candidatus Dormibacteraeota bacterium]|nr:HNH endonuclease [Candidatus Dormibacteraeota bacterium]
MAYTEEKLRTIFDRTDGCCHICGRKLCFNSYGQRERRGAWEIEHSHPRFKGGSDRLCNLYAAHISCNREKGIKKSRTARGWNGLTKAPLSRARKEQMRGNNIWGWGIAGAISGAALAGSPGLIVGAVLGAIVGDGTKVE